MQASLPHIAFGQAWLEAFPTETNQDLPVSRPDISAYRILRADGSASFILATATLGNEAYLPQPEVAVYSVAEAVMCDLMPDSTPCEAT